MSSEFKFHIGFETIINNAKLRKIFLSHTLSGNSLKLIQSIAEVMALYRVEALYNGHAI